jgi:NADH-ubiquinone oxidoreductase chain 4
MNLSYPKIKENLIVLGSLFLLLSILAMSSIMSTTDFDTLFKGNFIYLTQLFLFYGIFIAFAVKTPTIFLNTWLLKAHVESPLGGSIILAAIVLKLSLYGILRLILPILPKAYMEYTYIIFLIGVITIVYASLSTLRTIDIKELIAYSSVSHAAVYLLGVFSNNIQGIEGAINLGLAHGLVSPGLFICAGGVLYDRSHTRVISFYKGVTQVMPLFSILFFLLCLANCGAPLSLNFIGEFLSLYGVFERSSLFGVFASSSIVFSAAYTIYMYQRIAFGGVYSRMFTFNMPDLTKREFTVLAILVLPTILLGIYPAPIFDTMHYAVSTLIYSFDLTVISCDAPGSWGSYFQDSASQLMETLGLQVYLLKISDYPYAFTGLNFISSISSIISVAATALLLHIVYLQLVKGKAIFGFLWAVPQLFSDYLRMLKDRCAPGLEWELSNPPKPHAFTSLPLQSLSPIRVRFLEIIGIFNNNGTILIDILKDLKTELYKDPSFDCEKLKPWMDKITNSSLPNLLDHAYPSMALIDVFVKNKTSENSDLVIKYIDWYIRCIKFTQETNLVAASFLAKDEDAPTGVQIISKLLSTTSGCEQGLLLLDLLDTLDEEKKTNIIKELSAELDKNLTEEKKNQIMGLHALIQTLNSLNFDGFGSDLTNSILNELKRLSSTYPIQ